MLGLLRTWRYGQDVTLELHGESIYYDDGTQIITIGKPVAVDGTVGIKEIWTLLNTDVLLLQHCPDTCEIPTH